MHVVWKRPDGFHGARPEDFRVIEVGGRARIWLHKTDRKNFPMRIAGGWQESEATHRLNLLVNMLGEDQSNWISHLTSLFGHSMGTDPEPFFAEISGWLTELRHHLKGDTWETEIMDQVIDAVHHMLEAVKDGFLKDAPRDS